LIFPGELTNEKEKRRKQQQEMQSALAEQIKEQRAKKEQQKWLASASEAEATHLKYGTPRQGQNTTSFQPLHPQAQGEEDAERERKRLQQQELQRALALQVEEARQRKEEARRRQEEEDAREEERLRREIAQEQLGAKRPLEKHPDVSIRGPEARGGRRERENDMYRTNDVAGRDFSVRETEQGRTMKKTRDRLREDSWRDAEKGLRKTRERLRDPRERRRRPRTRDSGTSPPRDAQSPAPSTVFGPADTAGTWVGTCSPSPPRRDGDLGFQGFVEQQRQLASEMQRQVAELRSQRDQARQEALKVKEDAMNDRARHLQELQQVLAEQLQVPNPEVPKTAPEAGDPPAEVFERSIVSDSCFVALDAALTHLLSKSLVNAGSQDAPLLAHRMEHSFAEEQTQEVWTRPSEAIGFGSIPSAGSSPGRLTEQLNKEKVAAFRKALDTADGLPAELRQDLCALLEESTPVESPNESAGGSKPSRPPLCKGDLKEVMGSSPFPLKAQRPRARSSTPGSKLTPRSSSRTVNGLEERRAQSAFDPRVREGEAGVVPVEKPVINRRRSEALSAAACGIIGS